MKVKLRATVPKTIGVKTVPVESLYPNPHNPRLLFDREPLNTLKASIAKVGILVPLTVYRDSARGHFVILDGQRRWMCARQIPLSEVPVNEVAEPTLVQNIVTMFQIHKLREDWELMPTALKLELLMTELNERNDAKLAVLTGLPEAVVSRCKKLLSYPKDTQDLMLNQDPDARVKADFFIELYPVIHDRTVAKFEWFSRPKFTNQMLAKYGPDRPVRSVTDFRLIKQHINNARKSGKLRELSNRLKTFAKDEAAPISHLQIASASVAAAARKLVTDLEKITNAIRHLDVEQFYGEEKLWQALADLVKVAEKKLKDADQRMR
jgi:ParB family chromosome partitioning protein